MNFISTWLKQWKRYVNNIYLVSSQFDLNYDLCLPVLVFIWIYLIVISKIFVYNKV